MRFSGPVPSPRSAACCTPSASTRTELTVYFFCAHACTAAATASPASEDEMRLVLRRPSARAAGASTQSATAAASQETLRTMVIGSLPSLQLIFDVVERGPCARRIDIVAARAAHPDGAHDLLAGADHDAALRQD